MPTLLRIEDTGKGSGLPEFRHARVVRLDQIENFGQWPLENPALGFQIGLRTAALL